TRSILEESNRIAETKMDRWAHAFGLDMLGVVALSQGQNEDALDLFQHSLNHSKEIGNQLAAAQTSIHMGQAYAALQCIDDAKQLYREAYAAAETANWIPIILNGLVSFIEIHSELPEETRLAVARSVLSHPAVLPNLRTRCERLRDEIKFPLQEPAVEDLASTKKAETWARELLQ
ncbi:MAG TPA: tetratricopeptide repeat protein, partial [Anaerolineales bacterium]|nr:tetratricopeptide repeat protein [Anaerolineales bacterium]